MRYSRWYFKVGAYAVVLMLLFLVQTTRGIAVDIYGITLNLATIFLATLALNEGPYYGAGFGIFAALVFNISSGTSILGDMAFYSIFGGLVGYFVERTLRVHLLSGIICAVCGNLLYGTLTYVFYGSIIGAPFWSSAVRIVGTAAVSALAAPLVYFVVKKIHHQFKMEQE